MKKGFTLVEMLVVVAVLAILMSIVFRLGSAVKVDEAKNTTMSKMQKLENCLSGYYAAFGSYPPVKVHGSRDIYEEDDDGNRNQNLWGWTSIGEDAEWRAWNQVKRACEAQPIECNFPFSQNDEPRVEAYALELKERTTSGEFKKYQSQETNPLYREFTQGFGIGNPNEFSNDLWGNSEWRYVKIFRFGLMSYLLPRYLTMMNGDARYFGTRGGADVCAQWNDNNDMPCDPFEGNSNWSWRKMRDDYLQPDSTTHNQGDLARIANIPTQAVAARWMPNLEGICDCGSSSTTFFGINVGSGSDMFCLDSDPDSNPPTPAIYSPGDSGSGFYLLDKITVVDGWGNDFYYYSRSPFQSYTLWSAGANGRTFPPWLSIDDLGSNAKKCILLWTVDDLTRMKNN